MADEDDGAAGIRELTRWLCRDALMRPAPSWVVDALRKGNLRRQRTLALGSSSFIMMSELLMLGSRVRRIATPPQQRRER